MSNQVAYWKTKPLMADFCGYEFKALLTLKPTESAPNSFLVWKYPQGKVRLSGGVGKHLEQPMSDPPQGISLDNPLQGIEVTA